MPSPSDTAGSFKGIFSGDNIHKKAGSAMLGGILPAPAISRIIDSDRVLTPQDWTSGNVKREMTGDFGDDSRHFISKYGLLAAPFMPAMAYESHKKGNQIEQHQMEAAEQAQIMAGYNRFSPYQRNVPVYGQGSQYPGYYNDLADTLAGGAMRGLL